MPDNEKIKIIVFVSGSGTNLQAIIDSCASHIINATVVRVISNKPDAFALERATRSGIPVSCYEYKKGSDRAHYDKVLAEHVNSIDHNLIVLAGWMHILGVHFLNRVKTRVINLHPALPGEFPGKDAIRQAYTSFLNGKAKRTGIMVHDVVEEIDAGKVIETQEVPINTTDSYEDLENRVRYYEKYALIKGIDKLIRSNELYQSSGFPLIYKGKVRDVYDIGYNLLAFVQSDRQSAFDRHICDIPGKGSILTLLSEFWFNATKHIVPNHFMYAKNNIMICKKCEPFKVEVVVRGYMTGSTNTSLWTHYSKGDREYCGIGFRDGYRKNERLDSIVVTPTTKGETDELITSDDIVSRGLMTSKERDYVYNKALELYTFGYQLADMRGLILVDTKYEFGKDSSGQIVLIDEIHTCDSSRFWLKSTYQERFDNGEEPEKLDKDVVREYVRSQCDPYNEDLPPIPEELIKTAHDAYNKFYNLLTGKHREHIKTRLMDVVTDYFHNYHMDSAVIIGESDKDQKSMDRVASELIKHGVYSRIFIASAYKNPRTVMDIIDNYNKIHGKRRVVFIAVSESPNALSGIISTNSRYPVINHPIDNNHMSTNTSAMLVFKPEHVALAVKKIFM